METVVVDSSVAVKWFVVEPHSDDARKVLDGYKTGDLNLLAPDLINSEIGNLVWKKHRLQGLSASDAQEIIDTFRTIGFRFMPTAVLLDEAYRLAVEHQRTVYDMMYVALSIREQCRFVTADDRLVNAISPTYSNVIGVGNWT